MMHSDDFEDPASADLRGTATSSPGTPTREVDGQGEPVVSSQAASASDSPDGGPSVSGGVMSERKDRKDEDNTPESRSSRGRRGRGPHAVVATRAVKRGMRGHATTTRAGRGIGVRSKATHGVRPPVNRVSVPGDVCTVQKEPSSENKRVSSDEMTPNQSLEARRSTYFSICLNASPDELTVVSYNIRMEGSSCCCFDDNWRRREAALSRYLLSLEDAHHPDVILVQGAYSPSTLRLLKRLDRDEPMFPFQTRVVGGDPGCCKLSTEDGGCSCGSSCWYCLPFAARKKPAKKDAQAAFVTNNGWDSVSGAFSRLRGNGGLVVLSKWPILRRYAYIFTKSAYPKSLTNAGAALVQVEKCGKVYNVLAMQLQPGENQNAVRVAQVKEVMAWARTGMEDAEKVEFASFDIDGAFALSPDASTRPDSSEATNSVSEHSQDGGLPKLETRQETLTKQKQKQQQQPSRRRCAELPKGILKATDPLIIGGNLNFRFVDDHAFLAEALGPDGFRATLALEDASIAQPSFDTLKNDTCYQSENE
ncbi:hypothetical protein Emed_002333 [Eimeria media]